MRSVLALGCLLLLSGVALAQSGDPIGDELREGAWEMLAGDPGDMGPGLCAQLEQLAAEPSEKIVLETASSTGMMDGTYRAEFGAWRPDAQTKRLSEPDAMALQDRWISLVEDVSGCLSAGWQRKPIEPSQPLGVLQGFELWKGTRIVRIEARSSPARDRYWVELRIPRAAQPLEELFDDNARNWLTGASAEFDAKVEGGRYRIEKKTGQGSLLTWVPDGLANGRDFTLSARLSAQGSQGSTVGVLWSTRGRSDTQGFYVAPSTGEVSWGRTVNGQWSGSAWTPAPLWSKSGDNTMRISKRGDTVEFFVNGVALGSTPWQPGGSFTGFAVNGVTTVSVDSLILGQL